MVYLARLSDRMEKSQAGKAKNPPERQLSGSFRFSRIYNAPAS
jgi:hypothetical protein